VKTPTRRNPSACWERGELQLAILIETMRREGFELMVGKPEIVTRTENGKKLEPLERLVIDVPENYRNHHGNDRQPARRDDQDEHQRLGPRAHGLQDSLTRTDWAAQPVAHGHARHGADSFDFRGLDGIRRRDGTASNRCAGSGPQRTSTAFALWNIQERGELFIGPAIDVYEGMIVGENSREQDMDVNVTKERSRRTCAPPARTKRSA